MLGKGIEKGVGDPGRFVYESPKKPFRFSIDIVDACNLRCVICPSGVYYKGNTSKRMELDVFKRLLDKITSECECNEIWLYNWTEPFLHPELDKFVHAVKTEGIACTVSSNLSFMNPALLESVLMEAPALIVSVSGFDQQTHELYHKGSDVKKVKENLKFIANFKEKQNIPLYVEVHCLQFVDNIKDQMMWGQFCNELGFICNPKPAHASEVATPENVKRLLFKPGFIESPDGSFKVQRNMSNKPVLEPCDLHNTIPLDCRCDVYLCCIHWNRKEYNVGNYFDLSIEDIQRRRLSLRDCAYCTVGRSK